MTALHTPINVLDKMLALNLNISLWSARKKITFEDVNHIPNQDLPPHDLATLGSKKIAPPESLRVFTTLKARASSMLDKYGIRFMSGWGIPEDLVPQVMNELTAIRDEFNTEKEKFLNEYDNIINEWVEKHTQWQEMIRNATDSSEYVASRMNFAWQLYRVQSPPEQVSPENVDLSVSSGLNNVVQNLGNTLFDDIAKTADETWRKVYEGKDSVTQKALSPLKTLEQKLKGLSFIAPHVLPVSQMIAESLARTPKKGFIVGTDLVALQGLVCLMRDKEALTSHAQRMIEGQSVHNLLDNLLEVAPQTVNTAQDNLPIAAYTDVYDPTAKSLQTQPDLIPVIADSMGLW